MPYIVPSPISPISTAGFASASGSSSTPPHSPSHPPIVLTMALASPAPIPAHTTPFSPPPNIQSFGAVARGRGVNGGYPPHLQAPPLIKALSDMNTPTTTSTKAIKSEFMSSSKGAGSAGVRLSPPMRRTASASSAETTPGMYRYANAAGSSLPRVPRRSRGSFGAALSEQSSTSSSAFALTSSSTSTSSSAPTSSQSQVQSPATRGRTRSRFVLGAEEGESGSGSDVESKKCKGNESGKLKSTGVEERAERKRPVSAECSMALKIVPPPSTAIATPIVSTSSSNSSLASQDSNELEFEHSESGSECATPTPNSIAREREARERAFALQGAVPESTNAKVFDSTERAHGLGKSTVPGIAPRARRGRGRDGVKRLMFGDELDDEEDKEKNETSTVTFPSTALDSPVPGIAFVCASPEQTPFASPPQKDDTQKGLSSKRANAGSLRLNFTFGGAASGLNPRTAEQTVAEEMLNSSLGRTLSESASMNNMPLIRKKSGEVVRSSLKSRSNSASGTRHRPTLSLSDIAMFPTLSPSVSAPATPEAATAKMVHFDSQLEHVKLFLSGQKPAAVSRDGSPTGEDTTSGGEGDSASEGTARAFSTRPRGKRIVFRGSANEEEESVRRVLMMRVLNMPVRIGDVDEEDVRLEGLHLTDDSVNVQGIVRVRNIAFEKNVAIRFTFDGWQTTSEVIGKWIESCVPALSVGTIRPRSVSLGATKADGPPVSTFDRFSFSIRLADILLRIDEKTLVLAVRYSSGGREMWDNNGGQNYRAVFERRSQNGLTLAMSTIPTLADTKKEKDDKEDKAGNKAATGGDGLGISVSGSMGASLHSALDKVVANANVKTTDGGLFSPTKKASDFASRYDLGTSLKNPTSWRPTYDHSQTWAGQGQGRYDAFARAPLPWSTTKSGSPYLGQSSMASPVELTKARKFESHKVSFNSRGLPRGSPRDLDLDSMDESDVERISRARLAFSGSGGGISTPEGEPFPRFQGTTFSGDSFLGSPRAPILAPASLVSVPEAHVRNHHRSYFDAWATLGSSSTFGMGRARVTPPGTPTYRTQSYSDASAVPSASSSRSVTPNAEYPPVASPGRHYSFPPLIPPGSANGNMNFGLVTSHPWSSMSHRRDHDAEDSEASTPSITSVSSPTMTASPSSPPDWSMLSPMMRTGSETITESGSMDSSNYNVFLDKFCFYRGVDGLLDISTADIRRTHSASSVEELLSSPSPSSVEAFPFFKDPRPSDTPTASPGSLSPGVMPTPPTSAGLLASESAMFARIIG